MRDRFCAAVSSLIDRLADGGRDDAARDALLDELLAWQRGQVTPFGRIPSGHALPTDVFRYLRVAAHSEDEDVCVFRTSGTTLGARGEHAFRDLALYDRAARSAASHALFRRPWPERLIVLASHPTVARDSSLSYMLGRFEAWFAPATWVFADGALDAAALMNALEEASDARTALLGTSFAFVHAEDALESRRFQLPEGSFIMQTGGFKGRSREVPPEELRGALSRRYGVPERRIVSEYGMTELSSQMYEDTLIRGESDSPRRYWVPGWVRVTAVDPETLDPLPRGQLGVLRIDDLANIDSVCAIQTADLGIVHTDGRLELVGRAPGALPRGCSLAVDEAIRR